MARIFISHAHADRDLVAKLVTLLKNALALRGAQDVFCSSREGAGVTPGAEIREEVVQHLTSARALIVLLTPQSVGSPWVWFEAGARMAGPTRANPLFVVPAERFKSLPNVIADLRGVSLDNSTEVHGLVSVVARHLETTADLAAYDADVAELIATARRKYSRFNEARLGLARWVTAYALPLVILAIGVVIALAVRAVQTRIGSRRSSRRRCRRQSERDAGQRGRPVPEVAGAAALFRNAARRDPHRGPRTVRREHGETAGPGPDRRRGGSRLALRRRRQGRPGQLSHPAVHLQHDVE